MEYYLLGLQAAKRLLINPAIDKTQSAISWWLKSINCPYQIVKQR